MSLTFIQLATRWGHVTVDARAIRQFKTDLNDPTQRGQMTVTIEDGPTFTTLPITIPVTAVLELHTLLRERGDEGVDGETFTITAEGLEKPSGEANTAVSGS